MVTKLHRNRHLAVLIIIRITDFNKNVHCLLNCFSTPECSVELQKHDIFQRAGQKSVT